MKTWFKFYGQEFLSDPKMLSLTAIQKALWLTILCLASASEKEGEINYVTEQKILSLCGVTPLDDEWKENMGFLQHFRRLNMVKLEDNKIIVSSFKKRQEQSLSNAERQARYRTKHNKSNVTTHNKSNAIVTNREEKNRIEKNRIDNITNNIATPKSVAKKKEIQVNDPINDLIKLFEPVNPNYERIFPNKSQREALARMVKKHGEDKICRSIKFAVDSYGKQYAPQITTPLQLEQKLGSLIAYAKSRSPDKPVIAVMPQRL